MKKTLITLLLFVFTASLVKAQTTSFDVDGIKVIFKPTVKEIISVRIFYRGGVTNYPAEKAGIENLTLNAVTECGSKKYNSNVCRDLKDKDGIVFDGTSTYDYGEISLDCISKYFNEAWDLFGNAVVNPIFDADELALLKNKLISEANVAQSNPDYHIHSMDMKNAFKGTPYEIDPKGKAETINGLSVDELKKYYKSILNKNQIFIVIAGKISQEEILNKIKSTFASIPSFSYQTQTYTAPVWSESKLVVEKKELATNYISAIMNAPEVNSPDYLAFRLGISGLEGALFQTLRTKLNLSYNPSADCEMLKMPYAEMHLSTAHPSQAVQEMVKQLNLVKGSTVSAGGLEEMKNSYIVSNYMKEQSSSAITESLGKSEILGGWGYADQLPTLLESIDPQQIQRVLNKYILGIRWSCLGSSPELEQ